MLGNLSGNVTGLHAVGESPAYQLTFLNRQTGEGVRRGIASDPELVDFLGENELLNTRRRRRRKPIGLDLRIEFIIFVRDQREGLAP